MHLSTPIVQNQPSVYFKCIKFTRKLFKFNQMDFQFAFWQMLYLFIAPQKLAKLFKARKKSKYQYARDDPAFLVLFACSLCVTSIGFAIAFRLSFSQLLKFSMFVIFVDCIGTGLIIATLLWIITNKCLSHINENYNEVEWGFAFDIHLNAFYPPIILLHFIQIIFYNSWIAHEIFGSVFLGNTFYLFASIYYVYITFLGYNSIHTINNSKRLLYPIPCFVIIYLISLIGGVNMSHYVISFYMSRIV